MNKSPAFQLYPKDFLVDTAMMTAEEVGAYIRLLCYAWVGLPGFDQGYIPGDERVFNLVGLSFDEWEKVRSKVMGCFCEKSEGVYYHKRLMSELEKQKSFRKQRVMAGKASGISRNKRSTSVEREPNSSIASSTSIPPNPPKGESGELVILFSNFGNQLKLVKINKHSDFLDLCHSHSQKEVMAAILDIYDRPPTEITYPPGLITSKLKMGVTTKSYRRVQNTLNPMERAKPDEGPKRGTFDDEKPTTTEEDRERMAAQRANFKHNAPQEDENGDT